MLEMQRNIQVVRRWWWLLLLAAIVGALAAYVLTKLLAPQQYQGTAIIALAPPPQTASGLYVTSLAASADAQLIPTQATAAVAAHGVAGVSPSTLASHIQSTASLEGQLLYVEVRWPAPLLADALANDVARVFMQQERTRLSQRYTVLHRSLAAQEAHYTALANKTTGSGQAASWLRAQYADSAAKLYQEDADAQSQAATQAQSMQLVQPATTVLAVGPKAPLNALLGAVLALLAALVFAYISTDTYNDVDQSRPHPVFSTVRD